MKPPRRVTRESVTAEAPLGPLLSAFKAGRLVALLRGEGLSKSAVRELLTPASAAKLQAILTEPVFSGHEDRKPGPETQPGRFQTEYGKLLVFKAREEC